MKNKTKFLTLSVFALLLLNIAFLAFTFFSKKHKPNERKMPREIVIEKLHFDENQIIEYDKIIKEHQKAIIDLDVSIRDTKNELYQLLNVDTINSVQKDNLFLKLADYQKQIETTHFNHFLEIKNLCKKEQLTDYKELTNELGRIFAPKEKKNNHE